MKPFISLTAMLALMATSAVGQTAPPVAYAKAPWWMKDHVITQTGFVFAEVPANRAAFSATFLTTAKTVEAAQAQAIERTRGLQTSLGGLGTDKVVVATDFTMRALYEQYRDTDGNRIDNDRGDKITGYEVSLTIGVQVRDLSQLQAAYGRVMAAEPTSATEVSFSLQPDNAMIAWLDSEATKDARVRATAAAAASGATLGRILTVDPTGRACQADLLAPTGQPGDDDEDDDDDYSGYDSEEAVVVGARSYSKHKDRLSSDIEAQALKNPFLQTPPMVAKVATACVVYALN